MSMGRAQKDRLAFSWQRYIVGVAALAHEKAWCFDLGYRLADGVTGHIYPRLVKVPAVVMNSIGLSPAGNCYDFFFSNLVAMANQTSAAANRRPTSPMASLCPSIS